MYVSLFEAKDYVHTVTPVFERFHLCFHAKTDANTINLRQKL
jgi:hypothetical protein